MSDLTTLRAEFDAQFTIMGSGDTLDELSKPEDLWKWIMENFDPKDDPK